MQMDPFSHTAAEQREHQGKVGLMMERKVVNYRRPYDTKAIRP